ncbi:hypothetical protein [Chthonobacter rhizosphaerae]|uniref:hypothetical protein n=1 Tax=Chthonobacter rhizosphaerae TaxID=2735553 RepID=UPI0015EEE6AD|nr:hypothetical protein [Chthonobacter rhizosphaerae]
MEPALVGLIGAILGILLSNLISRLIEQRRRYEKMLDIVTALHAEIIAGRDTAALQTADAEVHYVTENETPFGPADDTDFVFASIKEDLTILPIEVIHEIVDYYKLSAQSIIYTENLNHPMFQAQSPEEKRKYLSNLIALLQQLEAAAVVAYTALEDFGAANGLKLAQKRIAAERRRSEQSNQRANGTAHDQTSTRS